ncbi:MAG TPA: AAA family ATPase [Pirellulaceae bacterium]|nr:AAA family ATPase [Pirellulaceae bacterium]
MYQSYWQLDSRPFEHTSDARFHYAAESQRGALLKLRYVLENRRGAAVLAGESGLGKTLLVQKLLSELEANFAPRVHLVFPQMPADQLLTYLADQLTGQYSPLTATIDQSVRRIERLLQSNAQAGKHAIIAIDEAHLLNSGQSLEAIRLLMNFQHEGQPVATFLLAGQTGLVLAVRRLPALDERIAVSCVLTRLSAVETGRYIQHRLTAAGAKRTIFESSAVEAIQQLTHGIPRRINRLCDLALLVGYGEELRTLAGQHIESIHQELIGSAAAA